MSLIRFYEMLGCGPAKTAFSLTVFGSSDGHCPPRHVLSTNGNAVAVDSAVDKEHTPALGSLKLAVEGWRVSRGGPS